MLTILNMKDLDCCSASIVSSCVRKIINAYSLDPTKCQYWLTDNTAYMYRKLELWLNLTSNILQKQFGFPVGYI